MLLIGVLDDPQTQTQPTLFYEPDRDGNMAIFGTGGAGKSTALRALAVAAAVTPRGGPVHVYGLDFGANGLRMLEGLPHVGAIVSGDDDERVVRLLRMLRDLVDDRSARFAAVQAGSIKEYRERASKPDEARILLLVDGISQFRDAYEFSGSSAWFGVFSQIATDGRQVGVHVVVAGDRPNSVPASLSSTIQRRLVLRLASEDDYLMMGVPRDILTATSPPGRGISGENEVQVAVLGGDANVAIQARKIASLASAMTRQGVPPAPGVGRLSDSIRLSELPTTSRGGATIGVADENLSPIGVEARGAFMVAGPPGSGKTTALATIASALKRADPAMHIVHLAPRRTGIAGLGVWSASAVGDADVANAATALANDLEAGRVLPARLAVVIEGLTDFTATEAEGPLDRLIKLAVRGEQFVVGESESSTWGQAWTLAQAFKASKRGLLVAPGEMDGDTLLGTPTGRMRRADFPPGRGFLIGGGRATKLQVASDVA
jgi:S-DNA-T family DNA segregation ATPase FtsK/SpoIIIE